MRGTLPAVEITGLSKCYRAGIAGCWASVHALRGVDLVVGRHELVQVVGAGGAGKSTLLLCIAGLLRPDRGRIAWFGRLSTTPLPGEVAYVAARGGPCAVGTVRDCLARSFAATGRAARVAGRAVDDVLRRTGLVGTERARVAELGAGARCRLAIAQALLGLPGLLLLDEPTVGLDAGGRAAVADCVRRVAGSGVATIVATGAGDGAHRVASRVLMLEGGRLRPFLPGDAGRQVRVAEDRTWRGSSPPRRSVDPPSLDL